jgi:hypothetical protein
MKNLRGITFSLAYLFLICSCAYNGVQNGIHEKFSVGTTQYNGERYTEVKKEAIIGVEHLQFTSYEGRASGKDYFIIWTKVAPKPFTITHFALDTSVCRFEDRIVWMQKPIGLDSIPTETKRIVEFDSGNCSLVVGAR